MKKQLIFTASMLAATLAGAQDDMYFTPSDDGAEASDYEYIDDYEPAHRHGPLRDVDEYNRRGGTYVVEIDSTGNDIITFDAAVGVYPDSVGGDTAATAPPPGDYECTRQMSRFDDYHWQDAYLEGYSDGLWDSSWDYYPWYYTWWSRPWGYYSWWHSPYSYSWSSWYYGSWGYPWRYSAWAWAPAYRRPAAHRPIAARGSTVRHVAGGVRRGGTFGGYRSAGTTTQRRSTGTFGGTRSSSPTRSFGSGTFSGARSSGSFGGSRSGGSFGGTRSGGSFGGARSGGSFGGRR